MRLLYDLCSIENYLKSERSSVNIRYSNDWQDIVSSCVFLPLDVMEKIYNIYDLVYDYNYHYKLREDNKQMVYIEEIDQYIRLKKEFFETRNGKVFSGNRNVEYERIIEVLREHMKV